MPKPRSALFGLGAAALYGTAAVAMNFVNKATLAAFPHANSVLTLQMVVVLVVLFPLRAHGLVSFPALNARRGRELLLLTLLYAANVAFALMSLSSLNIPMYQALKRLTPMIVLTLKWFLTGVRPSGAIIAAVLISVSGCLLAAAFDLAFDLVGYVCALTSCLLQSGYLLIVERSAAREIGTTELLAYNAALSLPFLLAVVLLTGEARQLGPRLAAAATQPGGTTGLAALVMACACMGMVLHFSLFLCTMTNSALTTTIVGVIKSAVTSALGFFFLWGDAPVDPLNVAGITLNFLGGSYYTYVKYQERAASRQPKRIHSMGDGLSGTRDGKGSPEMGDEEDGETRVLLSDASAVLSHQPKK